MRRLHGVLVEPERPVREGRRSRQRAQRGLPTRNGGASANPTNSLVSVTLAKCRDHQLTGLKSRGGGKQPGTGMQPSGRYALWLEGLL